MYKIVDKFEMMDWTVMIVGAAVMDKQLSWIILGYREQVKIEMMVKIRILIHSE